MYIHHGLDFLFPSQKQRLLKNKQSFRLADRSFKKEIDDAVKKATIMDGRPFNDFSKPGIIHLLNVAIPGGFCYFFSLLYKTKKILFLVCLLIL